MEELMKQIALARHKSTIRQTHLYALGPHTSDVSSYSVGPKKE